jgi:uncharacterized protein YegL
MKDATLIAVLLDRSGSMNDVKAETISGFNHFLKDQQSEGSNASLTLVQFDSQGIDTVYDNQPIGEVKPLNDDTYQPRGMTPLLDALGHTINDTGKKLSDIQESERPDKVVFAAITDGLENASREFSKATIKQMIERQSDVYKWQFIYLGANQDAFIEAAKLGVNLQNSANFTPDNVKVAYASASSNVRSYRRSGKAESLSFNDEQRKRLVKQ